MEEKTCNLGFIYVIQKDLKRETYREAYKCQRVVPAFNLLNKLTMSIATLLEFDATISQLMSTQFPLTTMCW